MSKLLDISRDFLLAGWRKAGWLLVDVRKRDSNNRLLQLRLDLNSGYDNNSSAIVKCVEKKFHLSASTYRWPCGSTTTKTPASFL